MQEAMVGRTPEGSYSSRGAFWAPSGNPLLRTPSENSEPFFTVKPIEEGPLLWWLKFIIGNLHPQSTVAMKSMVPTASALFCQRVVGR